MQNIFNSFKFFQAFIKTNKLYVRLHVLIAALVLTVLLMQVGGIFLFEYIPNHLTYIHKAYQDQSEWKLGVFKLENDIVDKKIVFDHLDELQSSLKSPVYSWAKVQQDVKLKSAYQQLVLSHIEFTKAQETGESKAALIESGHKVIRAYDVFLKASNDDIAVKQSLISVLQLACLILVFCIASSIMLSFWDLLINRLGKLISMMPRDLNALDMSALHNDEFELLEKLSAEMTARLEGIQVETQWTNKTSAEKVRKMILSQNYLLKLAKLIGASSLNEASLKKTLYSLELVLGVSNTALVFNESGSQISAKRALYSSHWPLTFDEVMFDENLNRSNTISYATKLIKGECVQSVSIPLASSNGWLGLLLLETEANHYFEDTELQLFEATAQMLTLSIGFQAKEQEGRRVALLEERAVIARELHDSLAQSLSYMKFQIARLQAQYKVNLIASGSDDIVNDLREGLDNAYRELRELLTTFRVQMDVRGLDHVLAESIEEFTQKSSLNITLDNRLQDCRLSVNEEFHLLHIVREALSNIVRHSGANKVTIALVLQSSGEILVTIDDDGRGITFDKNKPNHYGLAIMTERAYCLGGTIEVLPRRRGGTRVRLVFLPK